MIEDLPLYISILFGITVVVTGMWIYAASRSRRFLMLMVIWTTIQSVLGLRGMYQDTEAMPPKIMLFGVLPALLLIVIIFLSPKGKAFVDSILLKPLTFFHVIRVPVEIVLFLLFTQGWVSRYMTFEGTNFDVFSGITAPLVGYIVFRSGRIHRKLLLGWNLLCLLLLLNVVIIAIFALPSPFQMISLDQPNAAVLYFPFNLLPTVVVPLVLFGHLVALRQLTKKT